MFLEAEKVILNRLILPEIRMKDILTIKNTIYGPHMFHEKLLSLKSLVKWLFVNGCGKVGWTAASES